MYVSYLLRFGVSLFVGLLCTFPSFANHQLPTDFSYRCLGGNMYELAVRILDDCEASSSSPAFVFNVQIRGTGSCSSFQLNLSLPFAYSDTLYGTCRRLWRDNSCGNTNNIYDPGFYYAYYIDTVTLTGLAPNCGWIMETNNYCCRWSTFTNVTATSPTTHTFVEKLPNTGCNNSPIPNSYTLLNTTSSYPQYLSHAMDDPDGDSLVYELATPITNQLVPYSFSAGLSVQHPLFTLGNAFQFDPELGQSSFITAPSTNQIITYDVLVKEYRAGLLIGSMKRSIQFKVYSRPNGVDPLRLTQVYHHKPQGWVPQGTYTGFETDLSDTLRFRMNFHDASLNDTINLRPTYTTLQRTFPNATLQMVYGTTPNQLSLYVTIPQPRYTNSTIAVSDGHCPIPNLQTYSILIKPKREQPFITGRVVIEQTNNCQADSSDPSLTGYQLQFSNATSSILVTADASGFYHAALDTGRYNVQLLDPTGLYDLCTTTPSITVLDTTCPQVFDFAALPINDCPNLSVHISAPYLWHCQPSYYTIRYCNANTRTATSTYLDVWLPPLFAVDSTTHPIDSQSNGYYRFFVDTVPGFGFCQTLTLFGQLDTACQASNIGHTYCGEVQIRADTICQSWSGPFLRVERACEGDSVAFRIVNIGDQAMGAATAYRVIKDNYLLVPSNAPIQLGAGAATPWWRYAADGATYRVEIDQDPANPWSPVAAGVVAGCISPSTGGLASHGQAQLFSLYNGHPTYSVDCPSSVDTLDSNDKQGFPVGYGLDHYIARGVPLRYRIRFKNTSGNLSSSEVILTDTLSPHLDPSTLQVVNASHPYTWSINNQVLSIRFANIWLQPQAQGFVDFYIQQYPNLPLGTRIENRATIETRTSRVTNTTWHTIQDNFIRLTDVPMVVDEASSIHVTAFPNPFKQKVTLVLSGAPDGPLQLEVYDLMGQCVGQSCHPEGTQTLIFNRQQLPNGIYFYRLSNQHHVLYTGRFIVH